MEDKYLTVTQLNKYIKFKLDNDINLNNVFLKGEISNFKAHTRGHMYFTLKDENSRINAVMFFNSNKNLKFIPQDGMKVMIIGKVSVYEATGGYQIYVNEMIEDGIGNLYIEFEKLKKKLELEGLFRQEHKKNIPKFPKRIGVVTASTGAAIKDILTTIKRRWPLVEVILFPSLVQGANAAIDVVENINKAQNYKLDTLIIGRGGGGIEDLWCFNDENVAHAIYDSKIPIISGVGHEIDFTIADFVADLRAPTPTAAAELAVPNKIEVLNYLKQINLRIAKNLNTKLQINKQKLEQIKDNYILKNPINIYLIKEEKLDNLIEKFKTIILNIIDKKKIKLYNIQTSYILSNPDILYKNKQIKFNETYKNLINQFKMNQDKINYRYINLINKLEILNPLLTIKRGYSIIKKDSRVISSKKQVKKNDIIEIEFKDGNIKSQVL